MHPATSSRAKRAIDVVGASVAIAATAPILAAGALAVRLRMGSPALFHQTRPGLGGRPFTLYKLRTMRDGSGGTGPDDAARLTKVGRWLRRTSIDELPELWLVLKGEMSLVGPRPLLTEYLPLYSAEQARRHEVRPGITGWAQIHGRNSAEWDDRLACDVWYVDNWSIALDLRILRRTVGQVLRREGTSAAGHATMPRFQGSAGRWTADS